MNPDITPEIVETVAEAIAHQLHSCLDDETGMYVIYPEDRRHFARAAIAACNAEFEAMLDGVPDAGLSVSSAWGRMQGKPFGANIYWRRGEHDGKFRYANITGYGLTRMAAIRDAVSKVKEQG